MNKPFNIIIAGVGGQGVITLTQIIAEAALIEGRDIKTSELHGLSQKGGSVQTHIRFGKKIYSPLIAEGKADLILGLEIIEGLRKINYANSETSFLMNEHFLPYPGSPSEQEIKKMISQKIKGRKYVISASKICQEKLGKEILSGVYLLGFAAYNKIIPLKPKSFLKAIENSVSQKYLDINIKAFKLSKSCKK